ncbi:MAG: MgtC/SapB family protein [Candidatus Zixiibacteriota bacterium]
MESVFSNSTVQLNAVLTIVLAAILGGAIGLERELVDKPVGIKTMMIVAGTSAMLMLLGIMLAESTTLEVTDEIRSDPSRIIQAIVTGIGFIGAGTILRHSRGEHIEGLTTAATILLAAAIGICVALHQFIMAVCTTAFVVLILIVVRRLETWLHAMRDSHNSD